MAFALGHRLRTRQIAQASLGTRSRKRNTSRPTTAAITTSSAAETLMNNAGNMSRIGITLGQKARERLTAS